MIIKGMPTEAPRSNVSTVEESLNRLSESLSLLTKISRDLYEAVHTPILQSTDSCSILNVANDTPTLSNRIHVLEDRVNNSNKSLIEVLKIIRDHLGEIKLSDSID